MKSYKQLRSNSDVCPECKEDPCVCNKVHESSEPVEEASELGDLAHETTLKHRFLVTYSDPHHTMVSKRKEHQQKHVLVPSTKDGQTVYTGEAEPLVKKYMKKQGYKVHNVEHVGMVSKKVNEEWVPTGKTATHTSGVKTFEYAKVDKDGKRTGDRHYRTAQGKVMGEEKEMQDKDKTRAIQRAMNATPKKPAGEYERKVTSYLNKKYNKEEVEQVDELNVMTLSRYASKARSQSMDKDNPKRYKRGSGAAKAYDKINRGDFSESVELDEAAKGHTMEAHGIKGNKRTPWRKTFKSHEHAYAWAEKNDAEVHGTRDLDKSVKEEVALEEAVTVDKKNYSWGKMVTVHHGSNTSFPLHPEHQAAIKKLRPGMKTTFKDETGRQVHAHREGDQVHLVHHNTGSSTATKATVGYHHFDEGYVPDRSGQLTKSDASAMSKVAALMAKERQKKAAQQTDTKAVKAVKQMHSNPMSEDAMSGQLDDTNSVKETSAPVKGSYVEVKPKTSKGFKSIRKMQEGTVDDHIKKVVKIYSAHRNLEDKASYKGDKAARAKHKEGAKRASDLLAKMREKQRAANADKPKPTEVHHDYSAAIAKDYKDQEAKRGIGHVRD